MVPSSGQPTDPHTVPQYPPLPPSPGIGQHAPHAYPNVDPQLNGGAGQSPVQPTGYSQLQQQLQQPPLQVQPQSQIQTPVSNKRKREPASERTARLRKACDSCSQRKVKCDENGPPCQACRTLGIQCTSNRQSKRRGPVNRHAENLRRQGFGVEGATTISSQVSPTQTARTLADLAQHGVVSAETTICPLPIIRALVDDYFRYIHPIIPLPHKPSFMGALEMREDMTGGTFLALLASVLGCLVAGFPMRLKQHYRMYNLQFPFPDSLGFVARCQQAVHQARGPGYLSRDLTIHDAIISYMQGLTAMYTYKRRSMVVYFNECLSILNVIGVRKGNRVHAGLLGVPQAKMVPNGHVLEHSQQDKPVNLIDNELEKRTFWAMFVTVRSVTQGEVSPADLHILPETKANPYPPLPIEADDECLYLDKINPQPDELISELTGFNANVRVYKTYEDVAALELRHEDSVKWEDQKRALETALDAIKSVLEALPVELTDKLDGLHVQHNGQVYPSDIHRQRKIQCDLQKTNIYASQISTRVYLLEKYRSLSHQNASTTTSSTLSPGLDRQTPPSIDLNAKYDSLTKATLNFLASLTQVSVEPNGHSIHGKIHQMTAPLLDEKFHHAQSIGETSWIPKSKNKHYLEAFAGVLARMEGSVEAREDEEFQMRCWAEVREVQKQFLDNGGV